LDPLRKLIPVPMVTSIGDPLFADSENNAFLSEGVPPSTGIHLFAVCVCLSLSTIPPSISAEPSIIPAFQTGAFDSSLRAVSHSNQLHYTQNGFYTCDVVTSYEGEEGLEPFQVMEWNGAPQDISRYTIAMLQAQKLLLTASIHTLSMYTLPCKKASLC
jgi:hypothetical protein